MSWGPRAQSNYRARKMAGRAAMRAYRQKASSSPGRSAAPAPVRPAAPPPACSPDTAPGPVYYPDPSRQSAAKPSGPAGSIAAMVILGCPILMTLWFAFGPIAVFVMLLVGLPLLAARLVSSAQKPVDHPCPHPVQDAVGTEEYLPWVAEMRTQQRASPLVSAPQPEVKPSPPPSPAPLSRPVPPPKPVPVPLHLTARQKQDRDDLRMREEVRWRKEAIDRRLAAPALKTVPAAEANLERKLQELEQQIKKGL